MKSLPLGILALMVPVAAWADSATELPQFTVYSPRVANQSPVGTFAMPVSALRYEPRVDLQARNFVEGQADLTIRGGIFENTGFKLGAVTILDPQTGHYFAELPVAPAMLGAPEILTGGDVARETTAATVGAVAYGWRPIRTGGAVQVGAGPHEMSRGEAYAAWQGGAIAGGHLGADVAVAHSESDGLIAFGDHRFDRLNVRLQLARPTSQTDVFAGYQTKFFGWPNLYTPFNSNESDRLQTVLLLVNHHVDLGDGSFVNAGVFHRRNKDDYAFNRFAPLGPVHPFQHTTWENGGAIEVRRELAGLTWNARGEVVADELRSTSLVYGPYHTRTLTKLALVPEKSWRFGQLGDALTVRAGATYDDSNRDRGAWSPVVEVARTYTATVVHRVYASYAQTTQEPTYTALNSSASSGLFRGNPNLGRERTRNLEFGGDGAAAGWTLHGAVFARRDDSLVDWTFRRGVTARTANAVNVDTAGVEALARRSWRALEFVLGYTGLTKDPDYRGAPVDASFYALNYARHRVTAAVTARLGHGVELRMDNVARAQAANLLRTTGGNNAVFSTLAVAYRPEAWRGVELTAQVDNLWNSHFQEVPAVPAAPRTWSVGASYVW